MDKRERETVYTQLTAVDMDCKEENLQELPSLIRMIVRDEISAARDELQLQLNALQEDISVCVCSRKIGDVEEALCNIDTRIRKLVTVNELLREEDDELKEKVERLESHSRKYNLCLNLIQYIDYNFQGRIKKKIHGSFSSGGVLERGD